MRKLEVGRRYRTTEPMMNHVVEGEAIEYREERALYTLTVV